MAKSRTATSLFKYYEKQAKLKSWKLFSKLTTSELKVIIRLPASSTETYFELFTQKNTTVFSEHDLVQHLKEEPFCLIEDVFQIASQENIQSLKNDLFETEEENHSDLSPMPV
jgi:hypothetical protein